MAEYSLDHENISSEELASVYQAWSRKDAFERASKEYEQKGLFQRVFSRRPQDPFPDMTKDDLQRTFGDAFGERFGKLSSPYSRTPGELDDRTSVTARIHSGKDSPAVDVDFAHSQYVFGNTYRYDGRQMRLTSTRDFIRDDRDLSDAARADITRSVSSMRSEVEGFGGYGSLSDEKVAKNVRSVRDTLSSKREVVRNYNDGVVRDYSGKDMDMDSIVKDIKWKNDTLGRSAFPSREACARIRAIDNSLADAKMNGLAADAEETSRTARSLKGKRVESLKDASDIFSMGFRDGGKATLKAEMGASGVKDTKVIDSLFNDSSYRNIDLRRTGVDGAALSKTDSMYVEFTQNATKAGYGWKDINEYLDARCEGMDPKQKEELVKECRKAHQRTNRDVFDGLQDHVRRNGTAKGFDWNQGVKEYHVQTESIRQSSRMIASDAKLQNFDARNVSDFRRGYGASAYHKAAGTDFSAAEKAIFHDSERRLFPGAEKQFREGYYGEMARDFSAQLKGMKREDFIVEEDSLSVRYYKSAIWARRNDEKALAAYLERTGMQNGRPGQYQGLLDSVERKGKANPELDGKRLSREEVQREIDAVELPEKARTPEQQAAPREGIVNVPGEIEPGNAKTESQSIQFVYVTEDNVNTLKSMGKLDTVSYEKTDYGTPYLTVGRNAYALPGDGLYLVKDHEDNFRVYNKKQFNDIFRTTGTDVCQKRYPTMQNKAARRFGKGIK